MATDSISRLPAGDQSGLTTPKQLDAALASVRTPQEALVIREKANILGRLAKKRRDTFAQAWVYHRIRLDAERAIGGMLPLDSRGAVKSHDVTSQRTRTGGVPFVGGTITPLPPGLSKQAAHIYRTLSRAPDAVWDGWNAEFETKLAQLNDGEKAIEVLKEHTTQTRYAWVKQLLRESEVQRNLDDIASRQLTTVDDCYRVLVIDPPWPMQKIKREVAPNQVGFDYPTMDEPQLAHLELPMSTGELRSLAQVAEADCHLWLWTTHKFLPMAFRLLDSWQFSYVCAFVWHKPGGFQPFGLPQYNCEFALYAHRGSPEFIDTRDFFTCFDAPRGAHSEKPAEFYQVVQRVTTGPRLDVFNRRLLPGFDGWGLEAQS